MKKTNIKRNIIKLNYKYYLAEPLSEKINLKRVHDYYLLSEPLNDNQYLYGKISMSMGTLSEGFTSLNFFSENTNIKNGSLLENYESIPNFIYRLASSTHDLKPLFETPEIMFQQLAITGHDGFAYSVFYFNGLKLTEVDISDYNSEEIKVSSGTLR